MPQTERASIKSTSTISLIDTNILVYANNEDSPFHLKSKEILEKALNGELSTAFSIQNLLEFYAIITVKNE